MYDFKKDNVLTEMCADGSVTEKELRCAYSLIRELHRAKRIHPVWPDDNVHRVAIVNEEAGELVKAVLDRTEGKKSTLADIRTEAVQTGAMCLRFILAMEEDEK